MPSEMPLRREASRFPVRAQARNPSRPVFICRVNGRGRARDYARVVNQLQSWESFIQEVVRPRLWPARKGLSAETVLARC